MVALCSKSVSADIICHGALMQIIFGVSAPAFFKFSTSSIKAFSVLRSMLNLYIKLTASRFPPKYAAWPDSQMS